MTLFQSEKMMTEQAREEGVKNFGELLRRLVPEEGAFHYYCRLFHLKDGE